MGYGTHLEGGLLTACGLEALIETVERWISELGLPARGRFGVRESDLDKIVEAAGNKENPVALSKDEMKGILRSRL